MNEGDPQEPNVTLLPLLPGFAGGVLSKAVDAYQAALDAEARLKEAAIRGKSGVPDGY